MNPQTDISAIRDFLVFPQENPARSRNFTVIQESVRYMQIGYSLSLIPL